MVQIPGFRIASLDQLEKIKAGCASTIDNYATTSAATSAIPGGFGVAADIPVMFKMFSALRSRYSLDNVNAADIKVYVAQTSIVEGLAMKVFECATVKGVEKFIAQFAAKTLGKSIASFIPGIGTIFAGYTGYKLTKIAGETYSNDCYTLCREILNA